MNRFGSLVLANTKTATIAAISLLLALAGLAIARQITSAQTAPASDVQVIHSTNLPSLNSNLDTTNSAASTVPNSNSSQTSVTINGQSIDVPENGSVSQTIQSDGTTTNVDVQSSNSSTAGKTGNTNHSSVNVRVHSNSSSSEDSL